MDLPTSKTNLDYNESFRCTKHSKRLDHVHEKTVLFARQVSFLKLRINAGYVKTLHLTSTTWTFVWEDEYVLTSWQGAEGDAEA